MINELLKIASEDDTWGVENCEKLAAVDEILGENFAMKEDFLKEQQEYLEDIDEKLEKTAILGDLLLSGATGGLSLPAMIGGGYLAGKDLAEKGQPLDSSSMGGYVAAPINYGLYRMGKNLGHDMGLSKIQPQQKVAMVPNMGIGGLIAGGIGQAAKSIGGAAAKGLGAAGLAGAGLLGTAVVNDLYTSARSALTKGKNFEKMIQADPELANYPADKVKAYFNTLHEKGGPEISGDPVISSAFVRQQLDFHGNILDNVTKMVGIREKLDKAHSVLPYGKLNFGG